MGRAHIGLSRFQARAWLATQYPYPYPQGVSRRIRPPSTAARNSSTLNSKPPLSVNDTTPPETQDLHLRRASAEEGPDRDPEPLHGEAGRVGQFARDQSGRNNPYICKGLFLIGHYRVGSHQGNRISPVDNFSY